MSPPQAQTFLRLERAKGVGVDRIVAKVASHVPAIDGLRTNSHRLPRIPRGDISPSCRPNTPRAVQERSVMSAGQATSDSGRSGPNPEDPAEQRRKQARRTNALTPRRLRVLALCDPRGNQKPVARGAQKIAEFTSRSKLEKLTASRSRPRLPATGRRVATRRLSAPGEEETFSRLGVAPGAVSGRKRFVAR
jgi:hypothetical protein